jgi:hypothetical protein
LRKEDQKKEVYFHDDHNLSTQKPIRNWTCLSLASRT